MKKIQTILLISTNLLLPFTAMAQTITNPIAANDLYSFIDTILKAVSKLGAVVVVFFVIYSGFLFVTAQGSEEKLKTAKKAITYTLIGAAILLGASLIATVIKNTVSQLQ